MPSGRLIAGLVAAVLAVIFQSPVTAHSGLRFSIPLEGSALGAAPTHVQLTFIEPPEPSLATIRVSNVNGDAFQIGRPESVSGDPLTLTIPLRTLTRGIYIVNWRVVSAVDGHATAGAFAFGVEMEPGGPPPQADAQTPNPIPEIAARTLLLIGLIVAVGAAAYATLRLGEAPWRRAAIIALITALAGLVLLAMAQSRAGDAGLASLSTTPIGRALFARAGAIATAMIGLAITSASKRWLTQVGAALIGTAACAAIVVHTLAGHAAAGRLPVATTAIVHALHVIAVGLWIGGLAIVVAGLRQPIDVQVRGLARFSTLAAVGLALVTITGVARSLQEIGTWPDLATTAYGRFVIAKVALLIAIAALGALNRWRHLPSVRDNAMPLRRTARAELSLAVLSILAAAVLATLPPPATATGLPGIEASGADFATTVKATFKAVSDRPGPNRFVIALADYDSGESIAADRVSLRFTPIDDPGIAPTMLALSSQPDRTFTGTGANLAFDGRWRVLVLIERGNTSVDVPIELEAKGNPQRVAKVRVPNEPQAYRIEASKVATVYVRIEPEKVGQNHLQIWFRNVLLEPLTVAAVVVTVQHGDDPVQPLVINRVDRHRVAATASLGPGMNRLVVIARTESGDRIRTTLELEVSGH